MFHLSLPALASHAARVGSASTDRSCSSFPTPFPQRLRHRAASGKGGWLRDGEGCDGGDGDDVLEAGSFINTLKGGAGDDTFVFHDNLGFKKDYVRDFQTGAGSEDVIQFDLSLFTDFADVMTATTQQGNNVVITWDGGNGSAILENINVADLHADDFAFV